jgi:hypothetical protein
VITDRSVTTKVKKSWARLEINKMGITITINGQTCHMNLYDSGGENIEDSIEAIREAAINL